MKIYISGKIGGLSESEYLPMFQQAEDYYKASGFDVVNPTKINHNHDKSWASYMIEDLKALKDCDAIAMLGNYASSQGALIEKAFAERMGLLVYYFAPELDHLFTS